MVNPFHSLTPGKTAWISIIGGSLSKKYAWIPIFFQSHNCFSTYGLSTKTNLILPAYSGYAVHNPPDLLLVLIREVARTREQKRNHFILK